MIYRNRHGFHGRALMIGDALAYGREDMNHVMREILITEGIRKSF